MDGKIQHLMKWKITHLQERLLIQKLEKELDLIPTEEGEQVLPDMSGDEQLQFLATNGMLVKRPLVVDEGFVLTGFKEKEWTEKML